MSSTSAPSGAARSPSSAPMSSMRLFVVGYSPPVRTVSSPSGAVRIAAQPPRASSVPLPEQAPSVTSVKVSGMRLGAA